MNVLVPAAGTSVDTGRLFSSGDNTVAEKFDPAPIDKHADLKSVWPATRRGTMNLKGLKDSFPASDPPSNTQPPKSVEDAG
jgi:hypothetical protein